MTKPTFINILSYLFVKYIAFFVLLAFKEDRFKDLVIKNSMNNQDLFMNSFYYVVYILVHILFFMLIFSAPMYVSFKVKNLIYFVIIIAAILIAEYFFYTWSASQTDLMNGVYNGIISILFLLLFFFRNINCLYTQNTQ
jgi:hypothetical protein